MKRQFFKFVSLLLLSLTLIACQEAEVNQGDSIKEGDKISVVTSFFPIYEFTKQVAGDQADVSIMVSAGEDAHHYEPSAKDVASVNEADVFVYSSELMEHWVESLLSTIENDQLVIARTADGLEADHHDHGHGENHQVDHSVEISNVADHYHTGGIIELTAELAEEVDYHHWHWYTRENADQEWITVPNQGGAEFNYEAPEENFEVRAVLFDDDHNEYAQSQPVEIIVDNHDHEHGDHEEDHEDQGDDDEDFDHEDHDHDHDSEEASQSIEIIGLAGHYHTGDVATLFAELSEEVNYDHWHWYIRESHDQEWEVVPDQGTDHFEYTTTGESFEVKVALFDDNHHVYAESEPVSVLIDDHENQDPHIWLDPLLAQEQVNIIRDALIKADPDGKDIYEENADSFNKELQALHEEYQEALAEAENRVFVVQHEAFGYLAERYDLEQVAIGGISTEVEPSPSRIAEIGDLVEAYNVPVIYFQQGANSAIAETVANETETKTVILYDLEVLSKELEDNDLGYIGAMRENLKNLQLSIH
ncbi:metal ABC transporter solute-binding protein, Zn/Mn family [Amphibacillus indicireducens]|uniref:Mn2+/Zn2+ ABC transporter substrate-binding protein n=1 Tax=Amphibacillus indicireducens TaxID=1076330 RepID=A0ABP7VEK6_9BACI